MEYRWALVGWTLMWISVSAAISVAVYVTGSAMPLWALLIPGSMIVHTGGTCKCRRSVAG